MNKLVCAGAAALALLSHGAVARDYVRARIIYAPPLDTSLEVRAYPLPTPVSVIYNRPMLLPGWGARSCFGYHLAIPHCSCN
jgi:hypothetical protein